MSGEQFDPEKRREMLLNPIGGYEWSLRNSFDDAQACGGLGGSADSKLGRAVQCSLVGFDEPAERLLKQAAQWVQVAIASDERPQRYFPGGTEASRFETLALCHWLLDNRHDAENLRRFVEYKDLYLNGKKHADKVGVSLGIAAYVDAGAFQRTLEIVNGTRGLSPPKTLAPRNETQMAYILSSNHLGLGYTPDDVRAATTKLLSRNINAWLTDGDAVRAAQWLKVIHWNDTDRSLSAKQTLMKAYDYLTRPLSASLRALPLPPRSAVGWYVASSKTTGLFKLHFNAPGELVLRLFRVFALGLPHFLPANIRAFPRCRQPQGAPTGLVF